MPPRDAKIIVYCGAPVIDFSDDPSQQPQGKVDPHRGAL